MTEPATSWHVYLVRTGAGTLYTGITTDVGRRVAQHQRGGARASRYLRAQHSCRLAYSVAVGDRSLASRAEALVKKLPKSRKEVMVASAPQTNEFLQLLGLLG